MLSDEEKKAYDNLIMLKYFTVEKEDKQVIDTILNLIEKQSKEIEELKDTNKKLYEMGKQNAIQELINNDYVSKDKIKSKIEEFKKVRDIILENEKEFNRPMMTYDLKRNDYCEKMLQSLLEKEYGKNL